MKKPKIHQLPPELKLQKNRVISISKHFANDSTESDEKTIDRKGRKHKPQYILRLTKKLNLNYAQFSLSMGNYFTSEGDFNSGKEYYNLAEEYYEKVANAYTQSTPAKFWGKQGKLHNGFVKHKELFLAAAANLAACIELLCLFIVMLTKNKKRSSRT